MTAMNTAKRNALSGNHIIQMAQLQQHWTYGLDAPQYSHTTRLTLPKAKPSTTIVRPTPTLADLLNPVASSDVDDPRGSRDLKLIYHAKKFF